jgi:hypothetical protein
MRTIPKIKISLALVALVAIVALAAGADAPPPALNTVGGRALVLGPEPGFDPARLSPPWWRSPERAANRFVPVDLEGRLVMRVDPVAANQSSTSAIGRQIDVPILSMPYLHWAWYLEPALFAGGSGDGLERGLRLTVGFYGGHPRSPQLTDRWFGGPDGLPAHDRRLDIAFGGTAQQRSENSAQHLVAVSDQGVRHELRPPAFEQSGEWKLEALDIARLYGTFWPRDRLEKVRIVFLGVGGLPGRPPATNPPPPVGYVAEVSLTR